MIHSAIIGGRAGGGNRGPAAPPRVISPLPHVTDANITGSSKELGVSPYVGPVITLIRCDWWCGPGDTDEYEQPARPDG